MQKSLQNKLWHDLWLSNKSWLAPDKFALVLLLILLPHVPFSLLRLLETDLSSLFCIGFFEHHHAYLRISASPRGEEIPQLPNGFIDGTDQLSAGLLFAHLRLPVWGYRGSNSQPLCAAYHLACPMSVRSGFPLRIPPVFKSSERTHQLV